MGSLPPSVPNGINGDGGREDGTHVVFQADKFRRTFEFLRPTKYGTCGVQIWNRQLTPPSSREWAGGEKEYSGENGEDKRLPHFYGVERKLVRKVWTLVCGV
ncbi:unnamed protein product [Cuscuta europaea]|uniref:Uncharacterized protein n=1 Tax=Cuscuta europaea TaxID=41803 RepID=A0A9P0YNK9_CUSEU|nr:unnamed protein product [Cuscuta europaea]